jgi:hypothetical protein
VFSTTKCVDVPPPASDEPSGRVCGTCNQGYAPANQDYPDSCVSLAAIVPQCSCPSDSGWFLTACGEADTRQCNTGAGQQTRSCDNGGNWNAPDVTQCTVGTNSLFDE